MNVMKVNVFDLLKNCLAILELSNFIKCIVTIFIVLSPYSSTTASRVKINGIIYLTNDKDKTAKVTCNQDGNNTKYNYYKGDVVIPSEIMIDGIYYKVTGIDSFAFLISDNLTSVTLPNTITYIGARSFKECPKLKSIDLPESLESLGFEAFASSGLESITIPNSVTKVDEYGRVFSFCENLSEVVVSENLTSIENLFFEGCSSLKKIVLPNSITRIGRRAFAQCTSLDTLSIPSGVIVIDESAFEGCNFKSLKSYIKIPFPAKDAFYGMSNGSILYVPSGTKKLYQEAEGWNSAFKDIIEFSEGSSSEIPIPTYTLSVKATGNGSATYDGTTAKNNTQSFTLNEGTSATITFSPDNGYRIKSVKVNSTDVTSSVSNNQYIVSSISANTTVEVEFEAIPIPTYTLYVKAAGNGSATYSGTTAKNNIQTFTLNEGTSATITFTPDNGYRIKSVKVNSVDVTSSVSNNSYTVNNIKANTTVEVEFEAIPIPTYTLSVKATGNGSATYSGTTAKNNTQTFTLNEGTSATISFSPDNGYRIKSVKVNSADVTSSISNNSYTVSNIKANATVEVEFEAIPIPTYTLSIKASGNGSATYNGTTAKNNTQSFTLNEGTNAAITFAPDNGYRIKSVKVNSTEVTTSVSNNQYTISNIKANTTVEVEFEAIPIPTYTLSVKATGNGSATYDGTTAKNNTQSFTLNEGTSAAITFAPDNGYRIKSVKVNSADVTSSVSNSSYTVSNIKANTTVEVEFEAIPIPTYTLSVKATGNGSATYNGTTAKNNTKSFTLNEGTSATITFAPDNGYRIKSVKVNSVDVTSSVSNSSYTVSNIKANTTVEVEFEAIPIPTYTLYVKASGNGSMTRRRLR